MQTIAELTKESMVIRNSDPVRSNVLKLLVADAKKIAKEAQREATQDDLLTTARRQVKETENAIDLIRKGGGDTAKYEAELVILKTFLPASLDEATIAAHVERVVAALPEAERNKKSMGKAMGELKAIEGMDMKIASKLLGQKLP